MKLKSIDIGGVKTPNNVFLAPMAGYTEFAFRGICAGLGAGLTFTEMVSAKGLVYGSRGTAPLLYTHANEKITAVQLFGSEPEYVEKAACSKEIEPFDIIDLNMGCPVPKVFKNGEGSALMNDVSKAEKIVAAAVASGKPVTVKMRLGVERGDFTAVKLARAAENAGAALVTVHGRYRPDYYSGEVDFEKIAQVKNAVSIPVIANGGVFTAEDADKLVEQSGADGVMIARGALYNPELFAELSGNACAFTRKQIIRMHIDALLTKFDDKYVAVTMRKTLHCYLKGAGCGKEIRTAFVTAESTAQIKELLDKVFPEK